MIRSHEICNGIWISRYGFAKQFLQAEKLSSTESLVYKWKFHEALRVGLFRADM